VSTVRGAVTFLTRIPVGVVVADGPGAAAFGLVGAIVGLVGAVPLTLLGGSLAEPWLAAIGAVAAMALVTGAMHLDGLADTADALAAPDPASAERARKDPALGSAGVVAVVLVVAADVAALTSLVGSVGAITGGLALIAVAAASRVVPLVATRVAGAAAGEGLASWFAARNTTTSVVLAAGTAALVAVAAAWLAGPAAWIVAVAAIGAGGLGLGGAAVIVERRGGLDGDGMGAIVELSAVAGLVAAAVVAG
jgi:adenosylcobinamide-GDP ribazoletransferase